jgi:broad specificity phosphatase PhoE
MVFKFRLAKVFDTFRKPEETSEFMTKFIMVRHGQTEWNRVERFRGRVDVPLNEVGLAQAEATGRRVAEEWQPAAVYSSPLSRAVKTAEAIARHFNLAIQIHPGLIDLDFGQWQGFTPEEVRERWPELAHAWYTTPNVVQFPDGENLDVVRERAMPTVRELSSLHSDQTIVLAAHTDINRIILLGILGLGNERLWRLRQENCAINVFEYDDGEYTLTSLNDTNHLRILAHP